MAQHDYIISNQTFPNTRADINNVLSAIASNNSGTSAPTTQYAGQFWIDTTSSTWTLYIHDGSDDIQFATIDTSANTVNFIDSELGDNSVTTAKIADGNVTSAKLSYPLTTFSSTGIDDNATSTAITIDSSQNVGIGISIPSTKLHLASGSSGASPPAGTHFFLESSGDTQLCISSPNANTSNIRFGSPSDASGAIISYDDTNNTLSLGGSSTNAFLKFVTGGASVERMRIDSSGRLIVNDTNPIFSNSKIQAVNSSGPTLGIKQTTGTQSAGGFWNSSTDASVKVISVYKGTSGNEVGSIGVTNNDNLYIQGDATDSGLQCGTNTILPVQNGVNADNTIDLGASTIRWKDLYLGGGLYVGGTGTANKLDDYEEGTWTPTINSGTVTATYATYTKIGNKCTLQFYLQNFSDTTSATSIIVTGLPFTINTTAFHGIGSAYGERFDYNASTCVVLNTTDIRFYDGIGVLNFPAALQYADCNSGTDAALFGTVTYQTT